MAQGLPLLVGQAGTTIGGITGGIFEGLAQNENLKGMQALARVRNEFVSRQLEFNSRVAEFEARDIIRQSEKQSGEIGERTRELKGAQRAALAAQGVDVHSGSALRVIEDTQRKHTKLVQKIRNNAWRQAMGYKLEAINLRTQSELARSYGMIEENRYNYARRSSLITGGFNAASSLTEGLHEFYSQIPRNSIGQIRVPGPGSTASGTTIAGAPKSLLGRRGPGWF